MVGCAIACALQDIFVQCKIFFKGTLPVKHIHGHLKGSRTPG